MSEAATTPSQLALDLHQTEGELFRNFRAHVLELIAEHGVSEAVCSELRNWGQFHDFPMVASWVRRMVRETRHIKVSQVLLESFARTFRGDVVGHLGRDLLIGPLNSSNIHVRESAIAALGRWLEHDEEGMWLDMAEDQLDRERDRSALLYEKLRTLVSWHRDAEVQETPPDREDEAWLEVKRECECELRGTFPILKLGPAIARLTGLDAQPLSAILELAQCPVDGDMTMPASVQHLEISTHTAGAGRLIRVWDRLGSFAFSVEPTATKGRFLLFCYLP